MAAPRADEAWQTEARALAALAGHPLLPGQDHLALAEAPGSPWFDALGNALALEALSHPLLAAQHAPLCAGIATFLAALGQSGPLCRAAGPRTLHIRTDDPRRLHIETPSHVFTGDLGRGDLVQALRAAPARPPARSRGTRATCCPSVMAGATTRWMSRTASPSAACCAKPARRGCSTKARSAAAAASAGATSRSARCDTNT